MTLNEEVEKGFEKITFSEIKHDFSFLNWNEEEKEKNKWMCSEFCIHSKAAGFKCSMRITELFQQQEPPAREVRPKGNGGCSLYDNYSI